MIAFRCWYCRRGFTRPADQVGSRLWCSCGSRLKIPRRTEGSSKPFAPLDWLIESLVYGGAGALIGFGLCIAIFSRLPFARRSTEIVLAVTLLGWLAGTIFGERGVNWMGQKMRDRESG
jgi:hypothetical protein